MLNDSDSIVKQSKWSKKLVALQAIVGMTISLATAHAQSVRCTTGEIFNNNFDGMDTQGLKTDSRTPDYRGNILVSHVRLNSSMRVETVVESITPQLQRSQIVLNTYPLGYQYLQSYITKVPTTYSASAVIPVSIVAMHRQDPRYGNPDLREVSVHFNSMNSIGQPTSRAPIAGLTELDHVTQFSSQSQRIVVVEDDGGVTRHLFLIPSSYIYPNQSVKHCLAPAADNRGYIGCSGGIIEHNLQALNIQLFRGLSSNQVAGFFRNGALYLTANTMRDGRMTFSTFQFDSALNRFFLISNFVHDQVDNYLQPHLWSLDPNGKLFESRGNGYATNLISDATMGLMDPLGSYNISSLNPIRSLMEMLGFVPNARNFGVISAASRARNWSNSGAIAYEVSLTNQGVPFGGAIAFTNNTGSTGYVLDRTSAGFSSRIDIPAKDIEIVPTQYAPNGTVALPGTKRFLVFYTIQADLMIEQRMYAVCSY